MALDKNIFSIPNNERSIDSFKTRLAQGGARPNLFEVEMDFPSGVGIFDEEIKEVRKDLSKYSKKVEDKAVAIKLNETKGMIKPLCKKSSVNDDNVINLLNYYELVNELKTIHG